MTQFDNEPSKPRKKSEFQVNPAKHHMDAGLDPLVRTEDDFQTILEEEIIEVTPRSTTGWWIVSLVVIAAIIAGIYIFSGGNPAPIDIPPTATETPSTPPAVLETTPVVPAPVVPAPSVETPAPVAPVTTP